MRNLEMAIADFRAALETDHTDGRSNKNTKLLLMKALSEIENFNDVPEGECRYGAARTPYNFIIFRLNLMNIRGKHSTFLFKRYGPSLGRC